MTTTKNWRRTPGGKAEVKGRYDGPALIFEQSVNNELLVTLDGPYRDWGYFNALDVLEAVIDQAKLADAEGTEQVLARAALS